MSEDGEIRVALMGKTGAGKSSLGNTLLGSDTFLVTPGLSSGTQDLQVETAERFGTFLQVTDTPGLCDTHRDEDEVLEEVENSVFAVYPGPHIILFVMRCDVRFTEEEYSAYVTLKQLFGSEICDHMIVVFNGMDSLEDTPDKQRQALDEEIEQFSGSILEVLKDVDFRYYGVNNKASRSARDQAAVDLMSMMEDHIASNGGAFIGTCNDETSDSDNSDNVTDENSSNESNEEKIIYY